MNGVPVDDLVQFLTEELSKEREYYGLVIDAPEGTEKYWLVGPTTPDGKEGLTHAEALSAALHRVSQAWDYTSKDHLVDDSTERSKVKTTALLAKESGFSLVLWAPRRDVLWRADLVSSGEKHGREFTGMTMDTVLFDAFFYLNTRRGA